MGVMGLNAQQQIYISEILANSQSNERDWVELYNDADTPVDLSGMYWTDDFSDLQKFAIPKDDAHIIEPKTWKVFYFDKKADDAIPFSLNDKGEQIGLFLENGQVIDSLSFGKQRLNVSFGRTKEVSNDWLYYDVPSPNKRNAEKGFKSLLKKTQFSHKAGFYQEAISVELSSKNEEAQICYTLDGTTPTAENCTVYQSPILIDTTKVLKAICVRSEHLSSPIVTRTFFINVDHSLPIFSLSTNEFDSLYYEKNFMRSKRKVLGYVEFFENDSTRTFNEWVDLSLAGGGSKRHDQRSLSLHTRSKYGSKWLKYPFFADKDHDKFRGLVLRNSGNSVPRTFFKDAFMHQLCAQNNTNLDYLSYRPVIVYINGNYWGIYNVREKKCKHYYERNHGINGDSLNVLIGENFFKHHGSSKGFKDLYKFIETNDMSLPENYDSVQNRMDIANFIDYQISELYVANTDWPLNNTRVWRSQKEGSKWRWLLFDLDHGFRDKKCGINPIDYGTGVQDYHKEKYHERISETTMILRSLLQNDSFKNRFINRFADLINTNFRVDNALSLIDSMAAQYEKEIPRQITTWYPEKSLNRKGRWQHNVENMREFARCRPDSVLHFIQEAWDLEINSVSINAAEGGKVQINDMLLPSYPFVGVYFVGIPIQLKAIPKEGYRFVRWEGTIKSKDALTEVAIKKGQGVEAKAIFEKR